MGEVVEGASGVWRNVGDGFRKWWGKEGGGEDRDWGIVTFKANAGKRRVSSSSLSSRRAVVVVAVVMVVAEVVVGTSIFAIKTSFILAQLQCYENHPHLAQSCSRNITNRNFQTHLIFVYLQHQMSIREVWGGHNHMVEESVRKQGGERSNLMTALFNKEVLKTL